MQLTGGVTPLTQRMWQIALDDVERNRVTHESGVVYFGAGTRYGDRASAPHVLREIDVPGVRIPPLRHPSNSLGAATETLGLNGEGCPA